MLSRDQIDQLFRLLNDALRARGEVGEIGIVGGAVMCLVYQAREATRDVDGIFEPSQLIRKLVAQIGEEEGVGEDWLNDGAKGYIRSGFDRQEVLNLSNLRVWAPDARYMLAMKCISARWDSSDRDDVIFLIRHLEMKRAKDVFTLIEKYYPKNQIPPKTRFLIEELFEFRGDTTAEPS